MRATLNKLEAKRKVLLVDNGDNRNLTLSARNLEGVTLIPTREGFRRRAVRLDGATVALKRARQHAVPAREHDIPAFILSNCHRRVDYIYYRLSPEEYLLVPATALPAERTTFVDTPASKYHRFKNTFAAVSASDPSVQQAS